MSKEYTLAELKKMKSKTNTKQFNETTEKDILEQTMADADLPNLTDKELTDFKQAKGKQTDAKK
jgi:hypothetical protein